MMRRMGQDLAQGSRSIDEPIAGPEARARYYLGYPRQDDGGADLYEAGL
jgi:hypothetical protein